MMLIKYGQFSTHSKLQLPWKIDCDALSDEDIEEIAKIIAGKFAFGNVYGIPTGGTRLADALKLHITPGYPGELPRELIAEEARPALDRLAEETADLEREIAQARAAGIAETPQDRAELEAADKEAMSDEEFAKACLNAASCLGRQ